jgi:hypothetical protein
LLQRAPKSVQAATTMRTLRRLSASAKGPVMSGLPVVRQIAPDEPVDAALYLEERGRQATIMDAPSGPPATGNLSESRGSCERGAGCSRADISQHLGDGGSAGADLGASAVVMVPVVGGGR